MLLRIQLIFIAVFILTPAYASAIQDVDNSSRAEQSCKKISRKLASVGHKECLKRQLNDSGYESVKGQPLLIKEYPPRLELRKPQAKILMLGGIHGDEYSSITIMFKWMEILDSYHSGLFHWQVAPLVNPDGLLQRKSQRMNANGVDLNRNFPINGEENASLTYWKERAYSDPRRYPGAEAMSEAETRWIVELLKDFKPDAIVAVHAPYGIIDFDGPPAPPTHLGPLHLKLLGTYPGSLGNYAGLQEQIPVVTVELPYAGIMPSPQEISRIWVDLVKWLRLNVPEKDSPPALMTEQKSH